MPLLDELHALQDRSEALTDDERFILDLATSLTEELHRRTTGNLPDRVTIWSSRDYVERLVDTPWELVDGRVVPKRWIIAASPTSAFMKQ